MAADIGTEHREDQVGEAVDHGWMTVEIRRAVHHAEDAHPPGDTIEVAELALQAAEDREADLARDLLSLLQRVTSVPTLPNGPASDPSGFCGPWPEMRTRSPRTLIQGTGSLMPPGACIGGGRVRPSSLSLDAVRDMVGPLEFYAAATSQPSSRP